MEGGVIAIKNIDNQDAGWLTTVPPLGSMDEDGNLTSEITSALTVAANFKKSQAYRGRYERFLGKVGLSEAADQQFADNPDVAFGPDRMKGYENVTLTFEMTRENNKNRFEGAVKGRWDPDARAYTRYPAPRTYDIAILFSPNVQNLQASSAELLRRYYGVRLERIELEYGNPNKFRMPIFARKQVDFPNWAELTPQDLFSSPETIAASTNFTPDNAIQIPRYFQTRIKFDFATVTTAGPLVVIGTNIFGEPVTETIDLTGETGTFNYITKNYYSVILSNGVQLGAGWADGTMQGSEYDAVLLPETP